MIWSNGDKYLGKWENNTRTGQGQLHWSRARGGGVYDGAFLENQLHGFGVFSFRGMKYEGEWRNDKREGPGTLIWENGDRYDGIWIDGGRKGSGILRLVSGEEIEQMWNEPPEIKYSQVTPLKYPK